MDGQRTIGVFDSGVGGLSILRHIRELLPHRPLLYFADQAHVPYGARPIPEIIDYSRDISRFLLERGADLLVVACNTATAAAIHILREELPQVPIVGLEPAVKPASAHTQTGVIAVLARPGTFRSEKYATLRNQFAKGVTILEEPCQGLVDLIEARKMDSPETEELLRSIVQPMLDANADTFILGCTHYPFIAPVLRRIVQPHHAIIDPGAPVARQVQRVLGECPVGVEGGIQFFTSGPASNLELFLEATSPSLQGEITEASWVNGRVQ